MPSDYHSSSPPPSSRSSPTAYHTQTNPLITTSYHQIRMSALTTLVIFLTAAAMGLPSNLAVPLETTTVPTTLATSIVTETPIPSLKCDLKYCQSGTSWCLYFAGFTTFDATLGQMPGETITSIGLCPVQTTAAAPTPSESIPMY